MGFWSISGLIGDERKLIDLEQELAEVRGIIKKDHNHKRFDKNYYNVKANLEAEIAVLKRKVNNK